MMQFNRRDFLKGGALAATSVAMGGCATSGPRKVNVTQGALNIGVIGVGGKGWSDWNPMLDYGENIVALCDVNEDYLAEAAARVKAQKEYFTGPLANDVFQFSPMPWLSYTHISHTISGKKDASTPLFDWGKYTVKDGKWLLPFSVQAHHSFVDGLHIAKLADSIQKRLDAF